MWVLNTGVGVIQKAAVVCRIYSSSWTALSGPNGTESAFPLRDLNCQREGIPREVPTHSQEKGVGDRGRIVEEVTRRERVSEI